MAGSRTALEAARVRFAEALPTAVSALFYAVVVGHAAARASRRHRLEPPSSAPPVSVLKPLAGLDDELVMNLESFARLRYPRVELLLGVASSGDPAAAVARAFVAAHPEIDARVVVTRPPDADTPNPKVAQLEVLARAARNGVLVVSDANVRVEEDYLERLVAVLARPGVGLATSVVVGGGAETLGADLDAALLVAHVAPAIIAADALGVRPIAVGKSMAMRRADLDAVGGFASVGRVLAEDDALGERFRAAGFGVALSLHPVQSRNAHGTIASTFDRHARWAKMRRAIVPGAFVVEALGSPVLVAAASVALSRTAASAAALLAALALQVVGAFVAAWTLGARRHALRVALVEPLRAMLALACVACACASRRVVWRGHVFRLGAGSRLEPLSAEIADEALDGADRA